MRLLLTVGVFFLLANLRPYVHERTFWVDVACYVCLIAQFSLQGFGADRDYFAVGVTSVQRNFIINIATSSTVIRRARSLRVPPDALLIVLLVQVFARGRVCDFMAEDQASFWKCVARLLYEHHMPRSKSKGLPSQKIRRSAFRPRNENSSSH